MVEARQYSPARDTLPQQDNRVQRALGIVSDTFGVPPEDLLGKNHDLNSTIARYTFANALLRRHFDYDTLGSLLSNRSNLAIQKGLAKYQQYVRLHPEVRLLANAATKKIDEIWPTSPSLEDDFIRQTLQTVSQTYSVPIDDICGKSRLGAFIQPRFVTAYLLRGAGISLKRVGLALGKRDYATIIHAVRKIKKLRENDPEFSGRISQLEGQIDAIRERRSYTL